MEIALTGQGHAVRMLGTNDFQSMHPHTAWHAAQGIAALVSFVAALPGFALRSEP
jgi:hypothetical protein